MKNCILLFALLACIVSARSQSKRVVGYLPSWHFDSAGEIAFCKLTHINLAFANPDASGNVSMDDISGVLPLIYAGNPDAQVFLSIGGGQLDATVSQYWTDRIDSQPNRSAFVSKIVEYVLAQHLDGVDVDLEWDNVTSGYSPFVIELDSALSSHGKQLSAALPNNEQFANISAEALAAFDFVNIMSYDATGPWDPSNPGQHSSYAFAQSGIDFWTQTAQVPAEKVTLGVPFYGYNFADANTVTQFSYAEIVQSDPANADADQVGNAYYNGRPLISQKTALAMNETGGIMIWDLGQDSFDQYSLLSAIHSRINQMGILTTGLCGNTLSLESILPGKVLLFPNPVTETLHISLDDDAAFSIRTAGGQILATGKSLGGIISVEHLSSGYYLLQIAGKNYPFIKQ